MTKSHIIEDTQNYNGVSVSLTFDDESSNGHIFKFGNSVSNILPRAKKEIHVLSSKIRQARIDRGLSESELARQSGHAVSTIHGIENGDNENPGFKLIGDIASVLEIPLDELYQTTRSKGIIKELRGSK